MWSYNFFLYIIRYSGNFDSMAFQSNIPVKLLSSSSLLSQVVWQTEVSKLNLKFIEKCGMKHIRSYAKRELSDSGEIEMRLWRYAAFAVHCLSLLQGGAPTRGRCDYNTRRYCLRENVHLDKFRILCIGEGVSVSS